jgi:taurine dioxygenase
MTIEVTPLNDYVGAEIRGVNLSGDLDKATWNTIYQAYLDHSVLLFRDQDLTKAQHVAFSRKFGELELHVVSVNTDPGYPEIFVLGNVEEPDGGKPFLSRINEFWHSDSSFIEEPSAASLLYCRIAPSSGADTLLASGRTAYETLPANLKARIQGRTGLYSYVDLHQRLLDQNMPGVEPLSEEDKAKYPDVQHPLVRLHPKNGTRAIYVCETSTAGILDMDQDKCDELVADLCAHITRDEAVYRHRWRPGDLIIWDNRCTMHAATEWDAENERRLMHRTTVIGDRPIPAPPEEFG